MYRYTLLCGFASSDKRAARRVFSCLLCTCSFFLYYLYFLVLLCWRLSRTTVRIYSNILPVEGPLEYWHNHELEAIGAVCSPRLEKRENIALLVLKGVRVRCACALRTPFCLIRPYVHNYHTWRTHRLLIKVVYTNQIYQRQMEAGRGLGSCAFWLAALKIQVSIAPHKTTYQLQIVASSTPDVLMHGFQ